MELELTNEHDQASRSDSMTIQLHGAGDEKAHPLTVQADATIAVFLAEYRDPLGQQVLAVSLVDADEDLDPARTWREHGVRHGHRIHGHRCRLVGVHVDYNGGAKVHEFRSNKRVARIKDWAAEQFHITPGDAADLVLAYGSPLAPISDDLHIGDLKLTNCSVTLQLVRADYFNG